MNSTPLPKATEPPNAVTARADEQLAHAHEQIVRADKDLARLSEQLAKMERDAAPPAPAGPGPQSPPGKPALRAPRRPGAGGVHRGRCPGFAIVLWRRGQAGCRPLGAATGFNAIVAAGKCAASRAARAIHRSSGGGGRTAASNAGGSGRTARRRAGSCRGACRSHAVAANDGARSRESGAKHRTARGEPATDRQRQFKSHRRAQGEPGRDKTRAGEGFRAEPEGVTASGAACPRPCASPSGRFRPRTRERGLESRESGFTKTNGSRRCGYHRSRVLQQGDTSSKARNLPTCQRRRGQGISWQLTSESD